jgi:hypothetical protein
MDLAELVRGLVIATNRRRQAKDAGPMRLNRNSVLLAASALLLVALAFYAGMAPGSSATIAVDNCFASYDMLERPPTGVTDTGPASESPSKAGWPAWTQRRTDPGKKLIHPRPGPTATETCI